MLASGEGTATSSGTVIVLSANGGLLVRADILFLVVDLARQAIPACYSWVRAPRQADEVEPSA